MTFHQRQTKLEKFETLVNTGKDYPQAEILIHKPLDLLYATEDNSGGEIKGKGMMRTYFLEKAQ